MTVQASLAVGIAIQASQAQSAQLNVEMASTSQVTKDVTMVTL